MQYFVVSLFIIIVVAWFSVCRAETREDRRRELMQKFLDDSF